MPMEKEKKINKLPSGFSLLLSEFSHFSAYDRPFKKIHTNKPQTINMDKYTNRNPNDAILQSSLQGYVLLPELYIIKRKPIIFRISMKRNKRMEKKSTNTAKLIGEPTDCISRSKGQRVGIR